MIKTKDQLILNLAEQTTGYLKHKFPEVDIECKIVGKETFFSIEGGLEEQRIMVLDLLKDMFTIK